MSNDPLQPFQSPQGVPQQSPSGPRPGVCPFCGGNQHRDPMFTWWGGAVGHKIISHVLCENCGKGFNKKTGKDNTTAIVIYNVVAFLIIFPLVLVVTLFFLFRM